MLVYGAVNGTPDSGQNLNIVQHSSASSGFCMAGVNNMFLGSLTVTNKLGATNLACTNLACANLYLVINTSIVNQCTNYNTSSITFINASIVNSQSNLTTITNLSSLNSSFVFTNKSTLIC